MEDGPTARGVWAVALGAGILALAGLGRADQKPAADGKALYNGNCAQCHGRDGSAKPEYAKKGTPDLNDPEWQKFRSDEEVRQLISDGSEGTLMRPFKDELKPDEIAALVQYIRKLAPPPAK